MYGWVPLRSPLVASARSPTPAGRPFGGRTVGTCITQAGVVELAGVEPACRGPRRSGSTCVGHGCLGCGTPRPGSLRIHTICKCPDQLDGRSLTVNPDVVAPVPVSGVRGGTSRWLCRESQVVLGDCGSDGCFPEVRRLLRHAPLLPAMTTVETVSAPGSVGSAHRRCAVVRMTRSVCVPAP